MVFGRRLIIAMCASAVVSAATQSLANWQLQPVSGFRVSDDIVTALAAMQSDNWFNVTVPCTIIACLLQNNVYQDPFYSKNLDAINASDFAFPWRYRTSFVADASAGHALLWFKGLNYRADVVVNGVTVANNTTIAGAYRYYDFDVTNVLKFGEVTTLEVVVYPPNDPIFPPGNNATDLALTFIDWAPPPPDGSMGIWRGVDVITTSSSVPVVLRYPVVSSAVHMEPVISASLNVSVDVTSLSASSVSGTLSVTLNMSTGPVSLQQTVTLSPESSTIVTFTSDAYPSLVVSQPALWWPVKLGPATLHNISAVFAVGGASSDVLTGRFGIRQVSSSLNTAGNRQFSVNGVAVVPLGGGWASDLFFRFSPERLQYEMRYVLHMGLNSIRLEGQLIDDYFFDLADENGVMILPGWPCCDAFQHWPSWTDDTLHVAVESLRSQVKRLRIHPSVIVFLYGSDENPPPNVEQPYLDVFHDELWPNPTVAAASAEVSTITGSTGVKMSGPYAWTSPYYWLEGADLQQLGGAFGFLTEGGPGASPLTYESMQWTIPPDELWPMNSFWDFHCANPQGLFRNLRFFTPELIARYGNATSAQAFLTLSQAAAYESHRAMFEAYSRNAVTQSTGLIQWMLNNAWPEMVWHLYDYYLNAGGAFYGVRNALAPLHPMFAYDDNSVWVTASVPGGTSSYAVKATVVSVSGDVTFAQSSEAFTINSPGAQKVMQLPGSREIFGASNPVFLRLTLLDAGSGAEVQRNLYWLSAEPDVLDWNASNFYRTPCSSYTNYSELCSLPPATVTTTIVSITAQGSDTVVSVSLDNTGKSVAFFVRLRLANAHGSVNDQDVLPILWSDNYLTLFAGESASVSATVPTVAMPAQVVVLTEVFNNIVACE